MARIEAALFDLDGTLLDTAADMALAANAMRGHYGLTLLREDVITEFVGKGMENLVRRTLAGSLTGEMPEDYSIAEALAVFKQHYHRVNGDRTRIFEGVADGLLRLRDMGLALAVVTNKPHEFAEPLLRQTGLLGFFSVLVCGDTCARKKPDPMPVQYACQRLAVAPEAAVVIGDSINDAQAARAAGSPVLIVPYGYNEGRDVSTLDADGWVRDMPEAADWIVAFNQRAA